MEVVYALNLAAALLLFFWPLWFSRRYLDLPSVNPFTIVMALGLPVQLMKLFAGPSLLIEDGLADPAFQYGVLMGNLLVVAQTAGLVVFYRWFERSRIDRIMPWRTIAFSRRDLRRGSSLFLVLFFASFYALASAEFGVVNWLANPRLGYQLYRVGQGHWYALALSALSVSMVLAFLARPAIGPVLRQGILYIGLGYVFGSKTVLLIIFTSLLVFLWFLRWKHMIKLMVLGAPFVFALLVWNLYLALSEDFDFVSVLEYFDYYKNAADYYRERLAGHIDLYYGELTWSSLWAYVPRALWPDKPFVYGITIVNEIFYPGQAELTNTPAFGGAVEQYADFGVPGVLVFGFFSAQSLTTALLSYLTFRKPGIRLDRITLATVVLMIVQFAPGFGTFFPGALYLLLLGLVIVVLITVRRRTGVARSVTLRHV